MIRKLLLCCLFWGVVPCWGSVPASTTLFAERINAITTAAQPTDRKVVQDFIDISDRGTYIDVVVKELFLLVDLPEELLKHYLDHFSIEQGRWTDIDYTDADRSSWAPSFHAVRLHTLARAYANPRSPHYRSESLKEVVLAAIDYWGRAQLLCPNWWYNQIGVPRLMGPVYLLMRPEMSAEQLAAAVRIMDRAQLGMTGQNKVALAGCVLVRALLTYDMELARRARNDIASQIYVTTGEGLQPDGSFHQHGPMMQFGNYGLAYIASMAYWGRVFEGTELAFDAAQTELLKNYALNGIRWTVWRGAMDIAACGRQIFTRSPEGKAYALAQALGHMGIADSVPTGNKYFPRSDYMIHRAPGWYSSVRCSSSRTYGFETTNSENLLGTYSADGVTHTVVDGDEYYEIFPVWDWRRLPGLTVQHRAGRLSTRYNYHSNPSDFVGGVATPTAAVAAMRLRRDGLRARKAYFYIDNSLVCLGSGVESDSAGVVTTAVEQSLLKGPVRYGVGSKNYTLTGTLSATDLTWAHQNKMGYLFLEPMHVSLSAQPQSGSWSRIAQFYRGQPTEVRDVFSITITHRLPSCYAYALLPDRTAEATAEGAKKRSVRVVENSVRVQAVASADQLLVVCYAPCVLQIKGLYFAPQTAGIYIVERSGDRWQVAAADPTQTLSALHYRIGPRADRTVAHTVFLPSPSR